MFMHSRMLHSHTLMHTLQRDIGYGRMRVCAGKRGGGREREREDGEDLPSILRQAGGHHT